jgi:hypothetical protein
MAIPCELKTLQRESHVEKPDGSGKVAVRVTEAGGSFLAGIEYDAIDISYPSATIEVFEYYTGGLGGTLVSTITVTYTSSSKDDISTVVRT